MLKEERKAELMAYCRIDALEAGEYSLLNTLYESAVAYMEQAGVKMPPIDTQRASQYDLCINALVLDAWDHRGTQTAGQTLMDNPAFRRRLNQLKLTEPVSE